MSVFLVLAGNSFWYVRTYHTVVVLCYFFWFWREIVFGVTYVLSVYNTVVRLCQFLVVAGNCSLNENTFLQNNLIGLLYYDPLVSRKYRDLSVQVEISE